MQDAAKTWPDDKRYFLKAAVRFATEFDGWGGFGAFGDEDVRVSDEQLSAIARFSNGDARGALSTLEMVVINSPSADDGSVTVDQATLEQCISRKALLYDKSGEEHTQSESCRGARERRHGRGRRG